MGKVYLECEHCKALVAVDEMGEVTCGSCGETMYYRPGRERLEVLVWLVLMAGLLLWLGGCGLLFD